MVFVDRIAKIVAKGTQKLRKIDTMTNNVVNSFCP